MGTAFEFKQGLQARRDTLAAEVKELGVVLDSDEVVTNADFMEVINLAISQLEACEQRIFVDEPDAYTEEDRINFLRKSSMLSRVNLYLTSLDPQVKRVIK